MLPPRSEPRSRRSRADTGRRVGCLRYRRSPPRSRKFHAAKSAAQVPPVRLRSPDSLSGRPSLAAACKQEPTGQHAAFGRCPDGCGPTTDAPARQTAWSRRLADPVVDGATLDRLVFSAISSSRPPVGPRGESGSGASKRGVSRRIGVRGSPSRRFLRRGSIRIPSMKHHAGGR